MKEKVEGRTKNRLKRSSFKHEVKKLQKDYPTVLIIPTLPLSKQDFTNPCENTTSEIHIKTTISTRDMDTHLIRWFSNQGNYRQRRWYHHPVSQWCNTDCQFCHREALYQL